ncbi:hypothetical protein AW729_00635 [Methanosphaera sp. BMS]|nr:hypothetical protein AW729_00635 [Methanosphaera sp. BMS]
MDIADYIDDEYNYIISDKGLDYYRKNEYKLIHYNVLSGDNLDEHEEYSRKIRTGHYHNIPFRREVIGK